MEKYIDAKENSMFVGDRVYKDLPTVDMVEVVRCKDCKYFNGNMKFCDYSCQVKDDDYCSWGERK